MLRLDPAVLGKVFDTDGCRISRNAFVQISCILDQLYTLLFVPIETWDNLVFKFRLTTYLPMMISFYEQIIKAIPKGIETTGLIKFDSEALASLSEADQRLAQIIMDKLAHLILKLGFAIIAAKGGKNRTLTKSIVQFVVDHSQLFEAARLILRSRIETTPLPHKGPEPGSLLDNQLGRQTRMPFSLDQYAKADGLSMHRPSAIHETKHDQKEWCMTVPIHGNQSEWVRLHATGQSALAEIRQVVVLKTVAMETDAV